MSSEPLVARKPRFIAMSFGFTAALFVALVVVAIVSGGTAEATTYTITSTGGPIKDWNTSTTWTPNGVPGSAPGDVVNITTANAQVQLTTALANPLAGFAISGTNILVEVAGGNLSLAGASSVGTGATLRVTSGGTIQINGVTLDIASGGQVQSTSGGGTLAGNGSGSLTIQSGGTLSLSDTTTVTNGLNIINSGGAFNTTNAALAINATSFVTNTSGNININSTAGITSDNAGTKIDVAGGFLIYSAGSDGTFGIAVNTASGGTVSTANANLSLTQGGTHQGSLQVNTPGGRMNLSGTTTSNGSSWGGAPSPSFALVGGTLTLTSTTNASSFLLEGGTVQGGGTLTIAGSFTWKGGDINATGATLSANSHSITGAIGNMNLTGATLLVNSALTYNGTSVGALAIGTGGKIQVPASATFDYTGGTNPIAITSGGEIKIDSGGFFNAQDDASINGAGLFTMAGTFTKQAGAGINVINPIFNNTGSVGIAAAAAGLRFSGGGTNGGTFSTTATGSTIEFNGATHQFSTGTTFGGIGTFIVSGGIFDLDVATAFPSTTGFNQSGGIVTGSGNLTIDGSFVWSGGAMNAFSGTGQTILGAGPAATINGAAGATTLSSRTFINNRTLSYAPAGVNYLSIDSGGKLENNGTLDIPGDFPIYSNLSGTPKLRHLGGTMTKSAGAGTATITPPFEIAAPLSINSGTLTVANGGLSSSSIGITNAGNKLILTGGQFMLNAGTSVLGSGYLAVNGATAQLTLGSPLSIPRISLNEGTIDGANLNIANALFWTGGRFLGPGTTTMAGGSTTDHTTPTLPTSLDGRTFDNSGTFNYNPSANFLTLTNGATFNNKLGGSFNIQANGQIGNGAGANSFTNASTTVKNGGAGATTFNVPVTNTNSIGVTVAGGTLVFANGGGMSSGAMTAAAASSNLHFTGGTFTITGGNFSGTSGAVAVLGAGTLAVNSSMTSTAPFFVQNGGTVDVAATRVFALDFLNWFGGTFQGSGQTRVTLGGAIGGSTFPMTLAGGNLMTLEASVNYAADATNFLTITGSSTLSVTGTGTMNLTADGIIAGVSPALVTNAGILRKTAGAGASRIDTPFTSSGGTVGATSGTLHLKTGGGTLTNTILDTGVAAKIEFEGNYFVNAGSSVSGTGTVQITSGTVTIVPNVTIQTFILNSGALAGAGNILAKGGSWSAGSMNAGGTFTVFGGSTFDVMTTGVKTLQRNLTNDGTFRLISSATLNAAGGITFTNNSNFVLQATTAFSCSCAPVSTLINNGSIDMAVSGLATLGLAVNNLNSLTTSGGALLTLAGGGSHTGSFMTTNPSAISFNGGTNLFSAASTLGGGGTIGFNGTATVDGAVTMIGNASALQINGGTTTINGTASTPSVVINGGTLAGAGSFTVTGASLSGGRWHGGTISGTGAFTIAPGSNFTITGTFGVMFLDGRTITNNGNLTYSPMSSFLTLDNAASIVNGNTFQFSGSGVDIFVGAGGGTIQNNSAFSITAANPTTIAPAFTNAGSVSLQAGTTIFNSYNQTGGSLALAGGHMASPATVTIGSGNVTGIGTIGANLSNGGAILPGAGLVTGTIFINGTYTQLAGGKLEIDIGGTTPGTQYDVLATTGQPTLAGELKVNLISGFVPANGNTFDILGYTTAPATDFTTSNLPSFGAGGFFSKAYLPAQLRLTAVIPSTDVIVTQATSGPAHTNDPVTFTVTVTNSGGTFAANGVTLTNTLSGPFTFVSSSTTLGSCTGTTCNLGNLAPGASAVVTLSLIATGPGTITNTASTTSSTVDPNGANNTNVAASVTVTARADVSLSVTDAPDPVNAASTVVYTITLNNAGPNASANPSVAISVTNGTITGSTGPLTCSGSASAQTCTAASLATGATAMTVNVLAGNQGTTSLTASYSSPTFDNSTADNSATQSTAITSQADLAITKSGPVSTTPGTLVYTITVTNNGPSDAASVTVADPTPAGMTFVSNSGACTTAYPCSLGTLVSGATATINSTYTIPSSASGSVTNTATVSSTTSDPNGTNNSASVTTPVNQLADLQITKTGPASTVPGAIIEYTIIVVNNGPSDAANVTVTDPTPAQTTLIGVGGACSSFPCNLGTVPAGQNRVINSNYFVSSSAGGSITNTASVSSSTIESNPANNSSTVTTPTQCPTAVPTVFTPANNATGVPTTGRLFWDNVNAAFYSIYLGRADANGCNAPFTSSDTTSTEYSRLLPNTRYSWRVEAHSSSCPVRTSACVTFTTGSDCNATITLVKPLSGTVASPVQFEWQPVSGASEYALFAKVGTGNFTELGKTAATTFTASMTTDGTVQWFVTATIPGCGNVQSATATFTLCNRPTTPLARVIGEATSAKTYSVEWDAVPNAIRYEVDEATNPNFTDAVTTSTDKTSVAFKHDATTTSLAFYYRVRAFSACTQTASDNSPVIRIVIIPVPRPEERNPNTNIPAGSTELVVQQVFIPGEPNQPAFFTAVTDRPWLTVRPPNGVLPPEGITLEVIADPGNLPNGTFTATVIVTITTPGAAGITGHGTSTTSKPISISLVTPVTPVQNKLTPSADSLIIPSVGHLDGINSHWQSDIRVTNTSAATSKYALTFTPSAGTATGIKQTTITVGGGETTALDDIIKNWFGIGSLGDSANGMLEIRSADNTPLTAIASSRTYNVTANGTLGQYIPALPFGGFVGKALGNAAPTILSMQQISQSSAYRTNVGIVEASGQSAAVILSVFNAAGLKLTDIPLSLAGGEQRQLNSILAANNITLNDGRVEVKVTSGDGKVTAYASVVDNKTNDPLLVSGVATNQLGSPKYVLPGVADLTNTLASWRTDMRIFNTSLASHTANLTLHLLGGGTPLTASVSLQPGEVRTLDDVVKSIFKVANVGGAVHVSTTSQANLVVTGRTYNQTTEGTYGQFIEAVTPERAAGAGGRTLHVLQVEDSVRYRTNLGIAEVSGAPATVEVQVILPDSKVTPTLTFTMAPNEFRQLGIVRDLGLGNVYNARLSVRVISGQGRVTAYGSVIDMTTQDPTYVPAQ